MLRESLLKAARVLADSRLKNGTTTGFSLIELIITLALALLTLTVAVPRLFSLKPTAEQSLSAQLSSATYAACLYARQTGHRTRLMWQFDRHLFLIEEEKSEGESQSFKPIEQSWARFELPDTMRLKQFSVAGEETMVRDEDQAHAAWIVISKDGYLQDATIAVSYPDKTVTYQAQPLLWNMVQI